MTKTPRISAKTGANECYETPTTLSTTITMTNGNEDGSYRLSYTKLDQSGIMPNSQIDRHNFSFSGDFDVNERLSVAANANYIKTDALRRNTTGYNDNILGMIRQW